MIAMSIDYPAHNKELRELMGKFGKANPATMAGFAGLHKAASKPGALDTRTKELMALAIGICVRCNGCIAFHIHDALGAGATREEVLETIGVAVLMGGGPSMVYGVEALEALEQFEAEEVGVVESHSSEVNVK